MRITQDRVVPDDAEDTDTIIRRCEVDGILGVHSVHRTMVFSPSGARYMRLWECPAHPLPASITDRPDEP